MQIDVGDRVKFDTHSNLGICEDTVRELFTQHTTLGESGPALVLTSYSWCWVADVTEVIE